MTRKEVIETQAREHVKRGIYDSAICRSGMERVIYSEAWHAESTGKIHPDLELFQ